jgi:hypothetical protein
LRVWDPVPNESVFFGGFPGCERDPIGPHEMVFRLHSAMPGLTSFTEHQSAVSSRAKTGSMCAGLDCHRWGMILVVSRAG